VRLLRPVGDVTRLPTVTFGHRSLMWWGTLGFVMIEGTTLFICGVSYLYLQRNFSAWPPEPISPPALAIPTAQVGLMLASNFPMAWVDRAARRMDLVSVRTGMAIASLLAVAMTILRWFEFGSLHVRWDSNAYGSAAWATLAAHGTLLLLQAVETIAFTVLLFKGPVEQRDLSGASDNALYWYFITGVWIPLYAVVFLSPYIL
jgi:cytochrome c oxidase subunit III